MTENQARTAMADPETLVVRREDLALLVVDGVDTNRSDLVDKTQSLATRYLRGSGQPARKTTIKGFWSVGLSGKISEIRISQMPPMTTVVRNSWWAPRQAAKLADWRKGRPQVGQFKGVGQLVAQGSQGYAQPVVPISPASAGAGGGADSNVRLKMTSVISGKPGRYNAKSRSGVVNLTASGALAESDLGTLASSEDLIVWYLPEIGATTHGLSMSSAVDTNKVGVIVGVDTASKKRIVEVGGGGGLPAIGPENYVITSTGGVWVAGRVKAI